MISPGVSDGWASHLSIPGTLTFGGIFSLPARDGFVVMTDVISNATSLEIVCLVQMHSLREDNFEDYPQKKIR